MRATRWWLWPCSLAVLLRCGGSDPVSDSGAAAAEPAREQAQAQPETPPPPPPPPPGPSLADELRAQFLGGPLRPIEVPTGRFGTKVSFRQHRFLTMEITTSSSVAGEAVLSLQRDGSAHACFLIQTSSSSSSSKYANRDGVARHRDSKGGRLVGARGKWDEQGDHAHLVFDRLAYEGCQVAPDAEPTPQPLILDCFAFDATKKITGPWLACRVDDVRAVPAPLGLFVDDSPRAGSWEHRDDPAGRGEAPRIAATARPWLLLAKPALNIDVDDTDRYGDMTIEIELSTRELDESRWKPPEHEHRETPEPDAIPLPPELEPPR